MSFGKKRSKAGVMLVLLLGLFFCQINAPAQIVGIEFIFDIVPDDQTLSTLPNTGSTFYIQGKVYPFRTVNQATCQFNTSTPRQVGVWRAWGTVADDGRLVMNQSLHITTVNGTIEVQGVTGVVLATNPASPAIPGNVSGPTTGPTEILAVTGGTGVYRALNGEAQVRSYCSDPSRPFRYDRPFCLGVVEGRRR